MLTMTKTKSKTKILVGVILSLCLIEVTFVIAPAISKKNNFTPPKTTFSNTVNLHYDTTTNNLLTKGSEYSTLSKAKRKQALPELKEISLQRRQLLTSLIKTNPSAASNLLLTEAQIKKLPKELLTELERPANVSGEFVRLEMENFDPVTKNVLSSEEQYFLKVSKNKIVPMYFEAKPVLLKTGDRISGNGVTIDKNIFIPKSQGIKKISGKVSFIQKTKTFFYSLFGSDEVLALGGQTKKTAIILVNFRDFPQQPYSVDQARAAIFIGQDSVSAFYQENSFGQMSLTGHLDPQNGDVFGWYTLPYDIGNNCETSPSSFVNEIEAAAARNGYNTENYQQVIIGVATPVQCGVRGFAEGPGGKRVYIIDPEFFKGTITHEIGHNLGLGHAKTYNCEDAQNNPVVLSDLCHASEYGDGFSIMGQSSQQKHFNNAEKQALGWFTNNNILDITASGLYRVAPIEKGTDQVQMLRIPKERDTQGNVTGYYAFEYRQPFGFDNFTHQDPVVTGVTARIAKEEQHFITYLLDATPGSIAGYTDAPFQVGNIFEEPTGRFIMRVVRVTPEFAEVDFQLSHVEPTLSVQKASPKNQSDGLDDVTIISEPAGINCGRICTAQFPEGTEVKLTAVPNQYAAIASWTGMACGLLYNEPECRFRMNSDKTAILNFYRDSQRGRDAYLKISASVLGRDNEEHYKLTTLHISPPGNDTPISAGPNTSFMVPYKIGSVVNLTILPKPTGYAFQGWERACSGSGQCTLEIRDDSMNRDINKVTAVYEKQPSLSVFVTGLGHGRIISSPNGIDCGRICSSLFGAGTTITLRATAENGSRFVRWQDAPGCNQNPVCEIVMRANESKIVSAEFSLEGEFGTISVSKTGVGKGTIVSVPAGINCGVDCNNASSAFARSSSVVLRSIPNDQSVFLGWSPSSECTNGLQNNECRIQVVDNFTSAQANFGQRYFCQDSDGGDNLTERGTVRAEDQLTGVVQETQDICHSNYIWEATCSEDHQLFINASAVCPESFICSEGRCVPSNIQITASVNPNSPRGSIRSGEQIRLASFDIANTNNQEIILNEVRIQILGNDLANLNVGTLVLRLDNTNYPGIVNENNIISFRTPVSPHIRANSTGNLSVYAPLLGNNLVGNRIEVRLVGVDSNAHRVNGLPATTGELEIIPAVTPGVPDSAFYTGNPPFPTGIEIQNSNIRVFTINAGERQYSTRIYYLIEWLDAQNQVVEQEEQRGNTLLNPRRIESISAQIPATNSISKVRVTLDSRNLLEESALGEANNVQTLILP